MRFTLVTNVLVLETMWRRTRWKRAFKLLPHTATHVARYQRFWSRTFLKIATHRHSPSKTGGSHAFVLTCDYATRASYIRNSVLCWTTTDFKLTKLIEKTTNELHLTLLAACTTRVQGVVAIRATPTQLLRERPTNKKRTQGSAKRLWDSFITITRHSYLTRSSKQEWKVAG